MFNKFDEKIVETNICNYTKYILKKESIKKFFLILEVGLNRNRNLMLI